MGFLMKISDRVMAMDYGQKIMEGTPEEVQTNQKVIDIYLGEQKNA
jgi:branched-chain amino acid transport system ATP-binding protein